jgi:hypothetical protein
MLSIELLSAKDITQGANIGILNLLPGIDDLRTSLIHKAKVQNSFQIVDGICFHVVGLVTDGLVAKRARLVINVYLLAVQRHKIDVVFDLIR